MKTLRFIFITLFCVAIGFAQSYRELKGSMETTAGQRIEIRGLSGAKVRIIPWEKNEVNVRLEVRVESSDKEYESKYNSKIDFSVSPSKDVVNVVLRVEDMEEDGFSFWNLFKRFYWKKDVSGEIYVPKSNPLTSDLKYGTLTLEDFDGALNLNGVSNTLKLRRCSSIHTIENNYGTTTIEQSGGSLNLSGTSSTISVSDFDGKIHADADYSTVTISRAKQGMYLNDKSGTIKLEEIVGNTSLDADYSTITVKNVKGFVDVNSTSATIKVIDVDGISVDANYSDVDIIGVSGVSGKRISVKGQSGSLLLEDATGNVWIDNPYSNIELKSVRGNVELQSKSSQIIANVVTGNWDSRTEYCSLKLRKLTAKTISMTNKSDGIELRMLNAPDTINIQNEYGSVSLKMPAGFSGNFELDSEYGNITTNLPLKRKSRSSNEYAAGKIGSGNGSIIIETKSGDIEVETE